MSTKATKGSRTVTQALSKSKRDAAQVKLVSETNRLAKDATDAAIAAVCAAERASVASTGTGSKDLASVAKIAKEAREVAEQAVEYAKDAMRAESEGDVAGAVYAANLSTRAAQRVGLLSTTAAVLTGKVEAVLDAEAQEPKLTVGAHAKAADGRRKRNDIAEQVDRSARYLVTYDRRIIATFLREEDAFLLESELAEIDSKNPAATGTCVVLDRVTGERLGGYMMTNGKMLAFVRDDEYDARYGKHRH